MEIFCREYLLAIARAYAAAHDIALTTVSRKFHGADTFFEQFQKGQVSVTLRKYDEMVRAFYQDWPGKTEWPNGGTIKLKKSWVKKL